MKRFLSILMLIFLTSVPSLLFIASHKAQAEDRVVNYRPVHHRNSTQNVLLSAGIMTAPVLR